MIRDAYYETLLKPAKKLNNENLDYFSVSSMLDSLNQDISIDTLEMRDALNKKTLKGKTLKFIIDDIKKTLEEEQVENHVFIKRNKETHNYDVFLKL